MPGIMPTDRFEMLRSIQRQFEEELGAFPVELHPAIIRSYDKEDVNSPGLLSLVALPFWIGEKFHTPQHVCKDMAVGNLFLLHTFQSFDFIVDNDRPDTSDRSQVVLGNLCFLQVMHHYRPYFPAGSFFWECMEVYWREWGESMSWEVETLNSRRPFTETHLLCSAHKAAALKICPTGLSILAEKNDLIPQFEQAVDLMHAVMQLLDDLQDWREDLQFGRYNAFLGFMISNNLLVADRLSSQEDVSAVIYGSSILEKYLTVINDFVMRAKDATNSLGVEPWSILVDSLATQASWLILEYKNSMESQVSGHLSPETSMDS